MKKFDTYQSVLPEHTKSVVAIGNFDGMHLGHRKVLSTARDIALNNKAPSSVLTFEPHPREYFAPSNPAFRLTTSETRAKLIKSCGFDALFEIPFNENLANLSADDFIKQVLYDGLQVSHVVVGDDFRFGKGRFGNTERLVDMGNLLGFEVTVLAKLTQSDLAFSSSAVREALSEGNLDLARAYLGRWHTITGIVKEGSKVGRNIGYPTANLDFEGVVVPKLGVYSVFVEVLTGNYKGHYMGAASIGTKPTFGDHGPNLETYIFDFDGDIYGKEISVSLVRYLRNEVKFKTIDDLVIQMKQDCELTLEHLANATR